MVPFPHWAPLRSSAWLADTGVLRDTPGGALFQTRPPLAVVNIVCDDTRTAVAYFTELKREVKASVTLIVERAPCTGASPQRVVERAKLLARSHEEGDSTWAIVDMEVEPHKQDSARQAKEGSGQRVTVLLSNPCFEVWTLAHLIDTGEAFSSCQAVVDRVRGEWKRQFDVDFPEQKAQADYSKLMPLRRQAVANARRHNAGNSGSWTEVYLIVEAIDCLYAQT